MSNKFFSSISTVVIFFVMGCASSMLQNNMFGKEEEKKIDKPKVSSEISLPGSQLSIHNKNSFPEKTEVHKISMFLVFRDLDNGCLKAEINDAGDVIKVTSNDFPDNEAGMHTFSGKGIKPVDNEMNRSIACILTNSLKYLSGIDKYGKILWKGEIKCLLEDIGLNHISVHDFNKKPIVCKEIKGGVLYGYTQNGVIKMLQVKSNLDSFSEISNLILPCIEM